MDRDGTIIREPSPPIPIPSRPTVELLAVKLAYSEIYNNVKTKNILYAKNNNDVLRCVERTNN